MTLWSLPGPLTRQKGSMKAVLGGNVGPPLASGSSIMSFGAGLFRIRAMIGRPPIMSFDFGGLKI